MPLVNDYDLEEQGINNDAASLLIPVAVAALEEYLGVDPASLEQVTGTAKQAQVIRVPTRVVPVSRGIVTKLLSVMVDGSEQVTRFQLMAGGWAVEVAPSATFDHLQRYGMRAGQEVFIEYERGWTEENVPRSIKTALGLICRNLMAFQRLPVGVQRKKLGDADITFAAANESRDPVDATVRALTSTYRSPYLVGVW
jgi:hypothetical protein